MNTKNLAMWGVIVLAIPNALLTAVFFFILIGSLDYVFGVDWGHTITILLSILLGVAFTIGETIGNIQSANAKKEGSGASKWLILVLILIACTNWGAGMFRSKDNAREKGVEAKGKVTGNPRYLELQKENEYLQAHVLNDGFVGNDALAIDRQREIAAEMNVIEKEYVQSANILNSGGKWGVFLSLAFVVINIVYSLLVQAAFTDKDSVPMRFPQRASPSPPEPATAKSGNGIQRPVMNRPEPGKDIPGNFR